MQIQSRLTPEASGVEANATHPISELFTDPGTEAWVNISLYVVAKKATRLY